MSFPAYPAYKVSGVEWLGEIPEHWAVFIAKRMFGNIRESANPDAEQLAATQAYGVIPQKDFMERNDTKVVLALSGTENFRAVKANDFVISLRSFQGGIEHSAYDGCVSPAYTVLRRKDERNLNPGYLRYLLKDVSYISALQSVTTGIREGRTITYEQFGSLSMPVAPVAEQIQIARFLDHETARIDALIEEQQRLIELLKEKRQAVISHAVTKGLDHTVPMKDSGVEWLGEVPAHWRAVRLRHCLVDALAYGANEPSDEANLEHPRYIRITDLNDDGTLSAETYKSLPPDKAEPYMLEQGDVLFARSGATVGKSFLYSREYGPACYAGYLIRARVNKRALIPMYLWMCTQSRQYEQFIGESNIQATIQNVSAEKYGNMWIALPEIEEQEKILAELETQLSQFESLVETSVGALVLLQERRSALISAAVTGKIDVRGWQPPASAPTPELAQEAV